MLCTAGNNISMILRHNIDPIRIRLIPYLLVNLGNNGAIKIGALISIASKVPIRVLFSPASSNIKGVITKSIPMDRP